MPIKCEHCGVIMKLMDHKYHKCKEEEQMKGLIVKVKLDLVVVEPFFESVKREYIFKEGHFDNCDNIEEIRDNFLLNLNDDIVIDYISVYTFKRKTDLESNNFYEYLGE